MYYYSGSILPIEWTNQHGCGGNSKVQCEIVMQYACEDTLDPRVDDFWPWANNKAEAGTTYRGAQHFRDVEDTNSQHIAAPRDGVPRDTNDAATDTIPDNEASAIADTKETRRFGMHENYDYYQMCQHTERNKGLYTADQRINRNDQRGTRQNPNGNRHGLECPEERDYYPWWHPSPWVDIAVLTDSAKDDPCYIDSTACTKRCQYYMNNTFNFNQKGYCDVDHEDPDSTVQTKLGSSAWNNRIWYNNQESCETAGFKWYMVSHADNLDLTNEGFVCAHTQFSRTNQLGNARSDTVVSQNQEVSAGVVTSNVVEGVNANRFMWTIPSIPTADSDYFTDMSSAYKSCALRIRYNISSSDFHAWPKEAVNQGYGHMVDHNNNSQFEYDPRVPLHQNPYIYMGPGDTEEKGTQFVKLKVNTNQYARTFQDRSYVFSIKSLPTTLTPANNQEDTPTIDGPAIQSAISNNGKIYNVNVRGKRGNIVQVYPSVEYDFTPNALALGENDMIHFQWTGSDYNPRRGCNDATGGPPDLNNYVSSDNAWNPRADRSNVMFTTHMGNNVPEDYLGYDYTTDEMTFEEKTATSKATILADAPCYNPDTDSQETADECYASITRLAYLNQQSDIGSLILRQGANCLTQDELDAIANEDQADFHPLNCAKMNAKPYTYFDGGIMMMKKSGWFPFFSSRNNNFSNRQQIGVICVGSDCDVDASTGVLQDKNPEVDQQLLLTAGVLNSNTAMSTCYDTASGSPTTGNANAAHTCFGPNGTVYNLLAGETFSTQEGDNDNQGDGHKMGCSTFLSLNAGSNSVEQNVALAFILLAVGIFFSWLAYYLYNRYQARKSGENKFRYETAWQSAGNVEGAGNKKARPTSASFAMTNTGNKMSRQSSGNSKGEGMPSKPSRASSPGKSKSKASAGPKIKRAEMI